MILKILDANGTCHVYEGLRDVQLIHRTAMRVWANSDPGILMYKDAGSTPKVPVDNSFKMPPTDYDHVSLSDSGASLPEWRGYVPVNYIQAHVGGVCKTWVFNNIGYLCSDEGKTIEAFR